MANEIYSIEVKVPDGTGGTTTVAVPLDYNSLANKAIESFLTQESFPTLGRTDHLYLDKKAWTLYGWDGQNYLSLGSTTENITTIDGGKAV